MPAHQAAADLEVFLLHRLAGLEQPLDAAGIRRKVLVVGRRRLLAKEVHLTSGCVYDLLRKNGLKPHHERTYKVSRDPELVAKVRDIVGLYLNPPTNAVVLSMDEKTSIQALERTQLPLPMRSGRAARHTHDYMRHGIVDLYAALEVATGDVTHRITARHTAVDFRVHAQVVRAYPDQELHVILDNSSSHRTPAVRDWLAANPRVHFHYTPTSEDPTLRRLESGLSYHKAESKKRKPDQ